MFRDERKRGREKKRERERERKRALDFINIEENGPDAKYNDEILDFPVVNDTIS